MQNLVSDEFYNILTQISDVNYDFEQVIGVFRKHAPNIAGKLGLVLMQARICEPVRRSSEQKITNIEIYNIANGHDVNEEMLEFPIGNGGRVVVISGVPKDKIWTDDMKRDNYVISRMIYLLVGRAKTMTMLSEMIFTDMLTGIPNETRLNQFMGMTLGQHRFNQYCTNFLNIKNMKLMNSRYGQRAGDAVMYGYARAISEYASKQGGGIAARLGGDNFLVFIEASKEEDFLEFVKHITVPLALNGGEMIDIKVDSRLGYYYIKDLDGINDAMRNADVAAKLAKRENMPDFVRFEDSMREQLLKLKQLEENVPSAIDNEELVVFYQPKADITDANEYRMNGAEALVRWKKDGELLPPGEFIPMLEQSGLVTQVDFFVLERVCKNIRQWVAQGKKPVRVSSNFSRRHLQDKDFADKIEHILQEYDVDPKYIEIEITESYDAEDMEALSEFEKRMHEIGINLAVDDFGSGFSSLKMIKNIVADTIKLDKSIIDGIGGGNADDVIVKHIIMMINSLGKNVIAEGVETEKQAQFLRENGCSNIQGFLFARPCPKEEFEKRLETE